MTNHRRGGSSARGAVDALSLLKAHVAENGGEHRPQQEQMVEAVEQSLHVRRHLLVQAGTGTGKSLAYLFPLAVSGQRAVIATATNQLSEQLLRHDLPQVSRTLAAQSGESLSFALLKGRNNYACLAKVSEMRQLDAQAAAIGDGAGEDALFEMDSPSSSPGSRSGLARQAKLDSRALAGLLDWVESTQTGDRSEAPAVPDRVWGQVSTSSADCPGASACPFGEQCFTERARATARSSRIVVTNHALLAQDIRAAHSATREGTSLNSVFGQHSGLVVDEAHDFPDAITSALSVEVDPRSVSKFLSRAAKFVSPDSSSAIGKARQDLEAFTDVLRHVPPGPLADDAMPQEPADLMAALALRLVGIHAVLADEAKAATRLERPKRAAGILVLADQAQELARMFGLARSVPQGWVRWVENDRRDGTPVLRIAPIEVGESLGEALAGRTIIATSATLTLGSDFGPLSRRLGLTAGGDCETLDVGSPFDYPSQGMLYVPGSGFPEPVGRERTEHTAAVLDELVALVNAAGGRTLALFTTTAGAQRAAERLRREFPGINVLAHGDAPADVLVRRFSEDETSVLCATMGLWQGVSVEGGSCSLVVIDKVAFPPVDDVLTVARRSSVDAQGRDGFTEVIVAQAAMSLAQGVGRLIRTRTDRGVAAILDPRLRSKGYGRTLLGSLPDFRPYSDRAVVVAALERLTGGLPPDALKERPPGKPRGNGGQGRGKKTPARRGQTRALAAKTLRPRRVD